MRTSYIAPAVVAIAVAVLAIVSLADDGDSGGPFAPIADAAEKTANVPGAKIALHGEMEVPGEGTIVMNGSGAYNGRTDRSIMSLAVKGGAPEAEDQRMVLVSDGFVMYQRMPAFEAELPDDKHWIKIDLSGSVPDQSMGTGGSLKQQFEQLQSVSADAEDLGQARVRGVETTHYSATIDQGLVVEQLREEGEDDAADHLEAAIEATGNDQTPMDVWIDERGFLRRMSMEIAFGETLSGGATMKLTEDLYDFGVKPEVELPAEDDVLDVTELAQSQLEAASEQ